MRSLAVLSLHTSPLAQPGVGDGGGMNVYVRALSSALARAGVACDVYTRADRPGLAPVVLVEPGLRVHHVVAGPLEAVPKRDLPSLVPAFTEGVLGRQRTAEVPADAVHANYWLSGIAGHAIKHELGLPLLSTFHTLARVKADAGLWEGEAAARAEAEAAVIGCSDAVLASCAVEALQLEALYGADPDRLEIVPLGVETAFFSPGDRAQARRAAGLPRDVPLLACIGRIQPLKGFDVAVRALGLLDERVPNAHLVIIGGPSGPEGEAEEDRLRTLVQAFGLKGRVHLLPPQPHELLSTFYRAADVVLVPSRSESFGLVALEAGACGTPVVASAVGGLTTLVDDGVTGFLVDNRDAAAFADAAATILGDPVLAAAMGDAAARRAARYTWPATAGRLRRLVADLTSRELVDCS
ncbi:MAG TPA: glycosyltransferase [Acidimicrobiales bacterium]|nr:glycosyltransferase [Acidimicrobiales bacterium]